MHSHLYRFTFRLPGRVFGVLIVFFALALFSVELGRLYTGPINRGWNDSQYLLYPDTVIGFNGNQQNPQIENRWMWPWSTATLLFGLVFVFTGALGIVSGQRESYSKILTFFISSAVSGCLLIFLIASYSTTIAGWRSLDGNSLPRLDRDLSIVCLVISSLLLVLFAAALICTGRSIDLCTRKYLTLFFVH